MFDDNLKITSLSFFIADFTLLTCDFDNFRLLNRNQIIVQRIHNTLTVPYKKSKTVPYASSRMKNIVVFPSRSKFPITLIHGIDLGSASRACCLLKSNAIVL